MNSIHSLIFFLLFSFAVGSFGTDLFVVLLKGSKVFTRLGELAFLHTLSDIPVHEGTLGVHEIELVVNAGKSLGNGGGVGNHCAGAHDLGEIATRHHGGWLVVDAALETGR